MKVLMLNGSPDKNGNTNNALEIMCDVFTKSNVESEIITIGNKKITGCIACGYCGKAPENLCVNTSDEVNEIVGKFCDADALVISSPVYFSGINGTMKSFLDRAFYVSGKKKYLKNKVGASLVTLRRSGGVTTFDQLNHFLSFAEMVVATSNYWNVLHGGEEGVSQDKEGVQIAERLAENMVWLMQSINKSAVPAPAVLPKEYTNFIR